MFVVPIYKSRFIFICFMLFCFLLAIILPIFFKEFIYISFEEEFYDNITTEESIFNFKSFYAEYDLIFYESGNPKAYFVTQWYKGGKQKFKIVDKFGSESYILSTDNKIVIDKLSESNKTIPTLVNNINVSNILRVIKTYYELKQNENLVHNCTAHESKTEDGTMLKMSAGKHIDSSCMLCNYKELSNIQDIMLELNLSNLPKNLSMFNENGKIKYYIAYRVFKINVEISEDIFNSDK